MPIITRQDCNPKRHNSMSCHEHNQDFRSDICVTSRVDILLKANTLPPNVLSTVCHQGLG